ncbi:MAG: hypothetical protein R3C71_03480 [Candidatus Krumholzibacteriia bacterium]
MGERDDRGTFNFGNYFAAFIDLLGTTQLIRSVPGIPLLVALDEGFDAVEGAIAASKAAAVKLSSTLRQIDGEIRGFLASAEKREADGAYSGTIKAAVPAASGSSIQSQAFSDGLVVFTEVSDPAHQTPFASVYTVLGALSTVFVNSLYREWPVRIGVGLGWGAQPVEGMVYGACIESSYRMEQKAGYPRIVLHDDFVRYTRHHVDFAPRTDSVVIKINRKFAAACLDLVFRDEDGTAVLDYLKWIPFAHLAERTGFNPARQAFAFITAERKRFHECGDTKLLERYDKLVAYFESRRSFWDM